MAGSAAAVCEVIPKAQYRTFIILYYLKIRKALQYTGGPITLKH